MIGLDFETENFIYFVGLYYYVNGPRFLNSIRTVSAGFGSIE